MEQEGWLELRIDNSSFNRWIKIYAVLDDKKITFYSNQDKEKMKGAIFMRECRSVRAVLCKDREFCFKIGTIKGKYPVFQAQSQEEMKAWISHLQQGQALAKDSDDRSCRGIVRLADFEILSTIGRGNFGRVLMVKYILTGQILAMKVLDKQSLIKKNQVRGTKTEREILTKINCPFLVKLYFAFQTPDKLYFVMDYINGGELFFHMQNETVFTPERVRFYVAEILLGVEYLHERGIIYRDLKPENILLTADGHICMTDFGISKEGITCNNDRTATFCGTPEYLAPEILKGSQYGKEVDWWSLGTLMYEMLTSMPPFYEENVQLMYQKIVSSKVDFSELEDQPDAIDFIKCLLEKDPEKRICEPSILKQHKYFESIDWEKLEKKQIEPPWKPPVKTPDDTSCFDETFTRENPALSVSEDPLRESQQMIFEDFSFIGDSFLDTEFDYNRLGQSL